MDPATAIAFPKTLRIPSKTPLPEFSLVGLGVRTVSFLGIKVYSVGFYADLANPNLNVSGAVISAYGKHVDSQQIPKTASVDEKIQHIVRTSACVLRISAFLRYLCGVLVNIPRNSPYEIDILQPLARWLHACSAGASGPQQAAWHFYV